MSGLPELLQRCSASAFLLLQGPLQAWVRMMNILQCCMVLVGSHHGLGVLDAAWFDPLLVKGNPSSKGG